MVEAWMCTRGTNLGHYVKDGKSICGSGLKFEQIIPGKEFKKCKKCVAKLEGSKFKVGDLVTLTPLAKEVLKDYSLDDAPWKVHKVKNRLYWVGLCSKTGRPLIIHEVHLMLDRGKA